MREIDVAIVGCGYVAEGHLGAWRKVPEAKIVAVSDLNIELAKKTAERWRIPNYYSTISDVLNQTNANLVDICTPPHVHAPIAVEAMKAGKNVLIEKPMTMTVDDAKKIVKSQEETGVTAGVLHNWLFDEPVVIAKSMVEQGRIGEVFNIVVEALNTPMDSMVANRNHWSHRFPGGRFSEMLAHPIYLLRHFLGGELELGDVQVSKVGDYSWVKKDELCATFKVGQKMGRAYASFNSSRDCIYINIYGKKGIIKLDLINSLVNYLPKMELTRFNKGYDSLRQSSQITISTIRNSLKIAFRSWLSGHDRYIRLFSQSLLNQTAPPVTLADGLAVINSLDTITQRIDLQEKTV
jgi:predicted dehydrogenase